MLPFFQDLTCLLENLDKHPNTQTHKLNVNASHAGFAASRMTQIQGKTRVLNNVKTLNES